MNWESCLTLIRMDYPSGPVDYWKGSSGARSVPATLTFCESPTTRCLTSLRELQWTSDSYLTDVLLSFLGMIMQGKDCWARFGSQVSAIPLFWLDAFDRHSSACNATWILYKFKVSKMEKMKMFSFRMVLLSTVLWQTLTEHQTNIMQPLHLTDLKLAYGDECLRKNPLKARTASTSTFHTSRDSQALAVGEKSQNTGIRPWAATWGKFAQQADDVEIGRLGGDVGFCWFAMEQIWRDVVRIENLQAQLQSFLFTDQGLGWMVFYGFLSDQDANVEALRDLPKIRRRAILGDDWFTWIAEVSKKNLCPRSPSNLFGDFVLKMFWATSEHHNEASAGNLVPSVAWSMWVAALHECATRG